MFSILLHAPLLAAPQQDLRLEGITQAGQTGQLTGSVSYGLSFSCGWELGANGQRRAMRYGDGGSLDLGSFDALGSSQAQAVDVSGRVVGWSDAMVSGVQTRLPFQYEDATGLVAIPMSGSSEGWAEDVSIFGIEIVGAMRLADGRLQAWEFRPGSSLAVEPLSTPAGWESEALTAEGQFIGGLVRDPSGREFGAVWDFQRNLSIVTTPGTGKARITGLGLAGTKRMCGWYEDAQGHAQSFIGSADAPGSPLTFLPTLGGDWAKAIETDGFEVVGSSADVHGQARAFSYSIGAASMSDFNERTQLASGELLTEAVSVEFGPILTINGTVAGQERGYRGTRLGLFVSPVSAGQAASLQVVSAPTNTLAVYIYGFASGATPVPGCPGLAADIASARLAAKGKTTAQGNHVAVVDVPGKAAGMTILVQAVLPEVCMSSEVVTITVN